MNKLPGTITEIIPEGHISLVKIDVHGNVLSSIVVDTPETAPYLQKGGKVNVVFKENEVAIAKSFSGQISMQNRFDCTITSLERGKLLCKVDMEYKGFFIVSLITAQAAMQLGLSIGDAVTALVKTNEISLSTHD